MFGEGLFVRWWGYVVYYLIIGSRVNVVFGSVVVIEWCIIFWDIVCFLSFGMVLRR